MPYYCTVPRCTSMAGKAKNVSFHQFPRDEELANLWNEVLKRGKPYTKYSKVCSLHFKPEDYTMTSVGKNKGQWRTLRKDAVPSQNLPSDNPVPWSKSWPRRASSNALTSSPSSNSFNGSFDTASLPNIMPKDLVRGYEMAQAIYMQTMLAMQQAAQAKSSAESINNDPPSTNSGSPSPTPSNSSDLPETTETSSNTEATAPTTSYKCNDCSKCFKDPDVFLIHKRTHIKNGEKENLDLNLQNRNNALKSNPILANLLNGVKPDVSTLYDINSILSIENQIMTALAANMESYIRNLSNMVQATDASNALQSSVTKISGTLSQFSNDNSEEGNATDLDANVIEENCDNIELNSSANSENLVIDETV